MNLRIKVESDVTHKIQLRSLMRKKSTLTTINKIARNHYLMIALFCEFNRHPKTGPFILTQIVYDFNRDKALRANEGH